MMLALLRAVHSVEITSASTPAITSMFSMTRIRPAASCSRQGAVSVRCEASAAKVCFKVNKHLQFGQALAVVGNCPALGEWAPERAVKLSWSEGDCWTGELSIPMGWVFEGI